MQQNISPEIITFFSAMIPLLDLKIAIPIGKELGLTSLSAFLFATAGAVIARASSIIHQKTAWMYGLLHSLSWSTIVFFKLTK